MAAASQWVPKPGFKVDPNDRPRPLTKEEIRGILRLIPKVPSAIKIPIPKDVDTATAKKLKEGDISEVATKNIKNTIKKFLRKVQICPSQIQNLAQSIVKKFETSLVHPGSAVGITAAEAVGRTASQQVLNSFHVSGSAKNVSYGLEGMKEMIGATKNRKNPSCTIVFKDKTLSYLDVLRKRRDIVGITVGQLIKDYDIVAVDELEQFYWHKIYAVMFPNKKIPTSGHVLRIFLNTNMMFQYRVTMERICKAIEKETAICVYSPLPFIHQGEHKAIIDIYPIAAMISERSGKKKISSLDRPGLIFLNSVLKPALDNLVIQGIEGITGLFPNPVEVLKIFRYEARTYSEDGSVMKKATDEKTRQSYRRFWDILYNKTQMKLSGLTSANFERLLDLVGIKVKKKIPEKDPNQIVVEMPLSTTIRYPSFSVDVVKSLLKEISVEVPTETIAEESLVINPSPGESPSSFIKKAIRIAETIEAERWNQQRNLGNFIQPLNDPIIAAARYYTADTNGTNLQELLARDDIDPNHTFSNDIHEMTRILGVDAAKTFYIYELNKIIVNSESYVESRHILLIASFVFNQGRPYGLTYTGISRSPGGYMGLASFQRSVEIFGRAALYGRSETMKDTSARIATGQKIDIGTGAVNLTLTKSYQKKYDNFLKSNKEITPEALEKAVKTFESQTTGGEELQYIGEYDENVNVLQDLGVIEQQINVLPVKPQLRLSTGGAPPVRATIGKSPTISQDLLTVLRKLSSVPAYPNVGTTQFRIGPIPLQAEEPKLAPGLLVNPSVLIQVPVSIPKLPSIVFVESYIKRQIVEVPVKMVFLTVKDTIQ